MTLAADLRSAFRNVRHSGWLSSTVVLILAVAIGVVTAIFSIAHTVLFRPLPVTHADRVMMLWGRDAARSQQVVELSLQDQRAWLARQTNFDRIELLGSVNWGELSISGPGQPFRAVQSVVSSGFFDVLGARPMIGRTFRPADDLHGAQPTVVLSADIWRQQFSSDPSVVGRLLTAGSGKEARVKRLASSK
jgi:putative ABC transport system permease protein